MKETKKILLQYLERFEQILAMESGRLAAIDELRAEINNLSDNPRLDAYHRSLANANKNTVQTNKQAKRDRPTSSKV